MTEEPRFLSMFPCCTGLRELCGDLEDARIHNVVISRETMTMEIQAFFSRQPELGELNRLSERICAEYGLRSVHFTPDWPREDPVVAPEPEKEKKPALNENRRPAHTGAAQGKPVSGELLFGKSFPRENITKIGDLTMNSGTVTVAGSVFNIENRKIQKNDAAVLSFSLTDYSGSVHVSKYIRPRDDKSILEKIHKGDWLVIRGNVSFNRYENDMAMEPLAIVLGKAPQRQDKAPGDKRVELHLHTRYSTLDALTDPGAAVAAAARWGHRAIAVTDHGVAQSFPEIWRAGKKHGIKVIYGVEGYLVNDVDDLPAIHGTTNLPLDCDFVGFDIETTGLDSETDKIIEIGAVRIENGRVTKSFQTFVDPEMDLPPEIVQLTGITDRDVFGAPSQAEAVASFIQFAGNLPLAAHNAAFDVGFITRAAEENGIPFAPVYIDTLPIAQGLLPSLRRYKLDVVAHALGLPDFDHHRASDDAAVCARIFTSLRPKLQESGAASLADIGPVVMRLRESENRHSRHIVILVRNKTGLKNLYELISKSHLEHFKKRPLIPKSLLMEYRDGLILGSACAAGELFDAILRHRSREEQQRLASFYDYLEIQPVCNNRFLLDEGKVKSEEELRELNRRILALGRRMGKPVVATGDVHFLNPQDEIYRHILLAGQKFPDADKSLPIYFKTTDEMLEEFSYLGESDCRDVVITAPNAIADEIEEFELLPKDLFPPSIPHAAEDLNQMVWDRAHQLYGDTVPSIVKERLDAELGAILGRHYEVIYMSAQKLVQNSLEHGYLVGSRGSVGSSLVAYMSGITEVNSLPPHYRCPKCHFSDFENVMMENGDKYGCGADMPDRTCPVCGTPLEKDGFDIPFETFLGFGGDKVPDIDLNFSGEYQAEAHKYTKELFGADHVFKAGTIGTLAEKMAYGYVKKYLEERGITVSKAEENRLVAGCVGVKRTTGQHPGGLVIIPQDKDVTDFCPVQHPADDADGGIITTHFEYHSMEANLLKLDELGHDDPTMIRMMEDMTGLNARKIPLDDKETMRIFTSPAPLGLPDDDPVIGHTGTIGVPEFGTPFTRQMLVDTQPTEFATLIRLSGFSHGTDVWAGNIHDIVVNGIAPTDKCVGCRDDIMLYLISMGMEPKRAFKFMEAVRKGAIHKGKPWPEGIEEEMQSLGVPEWWVESCRKIQYLFPKAHAVAYVMMAFRIAWFKVHQPLAYYSAYFYRRSQKDGFDAESMLQGIDRVRSKIKEIQQKTERGEVTAKEEDLMTTLESVYEFYLRGFRFLNIDLYKSDAYRFHIEDGALRPPFVAISGLGGAAAEDLLRAQKSGERFVSVDDVSDACPKVSQAHLEQLKKLGALGALPESRQVSLFDGMEGF